MDKLFFPINISNIHWTLAVIYIQKGEIHYHDSMSGKGKKYTEGLLHWLKDEHKRCKEGQALQGDWKLIDTDVPQQENDNDCGVFTIINADFISDDLPLEYSHKNMPFFRKKIGCDILRGSLNYPVDNLKYDLVLS